MKKRKKLLAMLVATALLSGACFSTPAAAASVAYGGITTSKYKVYLSPSAQPANPYCDGSGSEEFWMRKIADLMPAYLWEYGVEAVIADPKASNGITGRDLAKYRAQQAKDAGCDLYMSIHSNATNGNGVTRGTGVFYYTKSEDKQLAQVVAAHFPYPDKSKITLWTNDALWEMFMPSMPHVLVETAFHDDPGDAAWIQNNIDAIVHSLALAIIDYADIPAPEGLATPIN